jgi:hypothetical protein
MLSLLSSSTSLKKLHVTPPHVVQCIGMRIGERLFCESPSVFRSSDA